MNEYYFRLRTFAIFNKNEKQNKRRAQNSEAATLVVGLNDRALNVIIITKHDFKFVNDALKTA